MMRGKRNLLWLLPLALAALWPLWSDPAGRWLAPPAHEPRQAPGLAEDRPAPVKSFHMDAVLFFQHRQGVRDWQIRLAGLESDRDNQDILHLDRVEAQFFSENRRRFLITGRQGRYDDASRVLTLENDVRVHAEDEGLLVLAEVLSYEDAARRITTQDPVRISGENLDVRGQGLAYDMETGGYQVEGRVTAEAW